MKHAVGRHAAGSDGRRFFAGLRPVELVLLSSSGRTAQAGPRGPDTSAVRYRSK